MDLFSAINTRASAIRVGEPGPSREHLSLILEAGAHAPDHGKLAPWRFLVVDGAARDRLAEAMAAGLLARDPSATASQLEREREKVKRAPTIIVAAARVRKNHKIPEIEQVLAVAAAVQNMFLAAHDLGYGAMWKTGEAAYDPVVKSAMGLETDDQIVAFLYLGTLVTPGAVRPAVLDERVRWL